MAENVTKFQTFDGVEHDIEDSTARAELNNVYTKSEADALLANKVDSDEVYSKAVLNAILDSKADEDNVYSKTATDDLLAAKADAADVYTKTEADAALALKADAADVYTKTESDAALALKADAADVYTKTESDAALALKADVADLDDYTSKATFIQFQNDVNVEFQNIKTDLGNATLDTTAQDVHGAINELKAIIDEGAALKRLDLNNPLHTFTSNTLSYTVTEDCYLMGCLFGADGVYAVLSINGQQIASTYIVGNDSYAPVFIPQYPLVNGDVVTCTNLSSTSTDRNTLKIYKAI